MQPETYFISKIIPLAAGTKKYFATTTNGMTIKFDPVAITADTASVTLHGMK